MSPRELLLANLGLVRELVRYLARRHHLTAEQTDELESFVRLRLVEDDYGILRQFRQRSTLRTYLGVVVQRLFLDHCNQRWGKWRTSAAALRLGSVATALEELLYRQGLTFEEACAVLARRKPPIDREQLAAIHYSLPPRPQRLRQEVVELDELAAPTQVAPNPEMAALQRDAEEAVARVVGGSLRRLRAQDRLLLRLRFVEGLTVAQAARVLRAPQKALYKRLGGILRSMRRDLREAGVEAHDVAAVLQQGINLDFGLASKGENEEPRPSKLPDAGSDPQLRS
jgi:RNA polymerase sigma factor for flagellar operon FliA